MSRRRSRSLALLSSFSTSLLPNRRPVLKSNTAQPKHRTLQNYLTIWVGNRFDPNCKDKKSILTSFRHVVGEISTYTTAAECIQFINKIDNKILFVILSASFGKQLVNDIHDKAQVYSIHILDDNKAYSEQWMNEWPKVQGAFRSMKLICESLKQIVREYEHNSISMSFISKQMIKAVRDLPQRALHHLEPSYIYSTIFKYIILEVFNDSEKQIQDLVNYCRQQTVSELLLNNFQHHFHEKSPFWWYTTEIFLYKILNQALRSFALEGMMKLEFFIRRLHQQLQQLHETQSPNFQKQIIVYRGQGLSPEDFQHLQDAQGGLLSFNNFLFTTTNRDEAKSFAERAIIRNVNTVGIIFVMTIDSAIVSTLKTPFAKIDKPSVHQTGPEIVFTIYTVFHVNEIKETKQNNSLYEVQLTMANEFDSESKYLTDCICRQIKIHDGWYEMGRLMLHLEHFNQAEELFKGLLEQSSNDNYRAAIYRQLGYLKNDQGQYEEAIEFSLKSIELYKKTRPQDDNFLASIYSNLGYAYIGISDYSSAGKYLEKDLKITKRVKPSNHPDLATCYNNIGSLESYKRDHQRALKQHIKSLEIRQQSLPSNHPDLAMSYWNIGEDYMNIKNYSKALVHLEKALHIYEKSLPATHPNIERVKHTISLLRKQL